MPDHLGIVAGSVERQLDEVFCAPIGHQANAAARCKDRERIVFGLQNIRNLAHQRNRDGIEKRTERPRGGIGSCTPLCGTLSAVLNRLKHALTDL